MSERKRIIPKYGPFAGMRVIDSGSLIAMPYAATLLADFGAEVIHIERPGVGDTLRVLAPFATEDGKTVYEDIFHPITADARHELYGAVLSAYEQRLHMREDELQEADIPVEDEAPAFEQRL